MPRKFPRAIKRVVIKVGSSVIATDKMKPRMAHLNSLVQQICSARRKNVEVVLVSSGAIVLGMGELGLKKRPSDVASLQAISAIGQTVLMRKYNDLFKKQKNKCAQVLLTWDDFDNRHRYNNARNTFSAMMQMGVVPIINENDTISTDEIKFGDNDKLSALVSGMIQADLLLILSDVEGLYRAKEGKNKIFKEIKEITQEIEGFAIGSGNKQMSKGGMSAKLQAIKVATKANIPCIIANGETDNVFPRVLKGERIGTFFSEKEEKVLSRKHWISFGAKPKGNLTIDDGAKAALLKGGISLLLPGIISFEGHFRKNEVVIVQDKSKHEIGRGVINYTISDLLRMQDKKGKQEAIHCDNLVLSER